MKKLFSLAKLLRSEITLYLLFSALKYNLRVFKFHYELPAIIVLIGYYMMISGLVGQPGDIVQLISPSQNFSSSTLVTFRYGLMSSTQDSDARLTLRIQSPLGLDVWSEVVVQGSTGTTLTGWRTGSVCVPAGTYRLVFEGTHGHPYLTTFVLDSVKSSTTSCPPVDLKNIFGRFSVTTCILLISSYFRCFFLSTLDFS